MELTQSHVQWQDLVLVCKTYRPAYTTCFLEDEPAKFETCMRHQKLNINLEKLCILLVCDV